MGLEVLEVAVGEPVAGGSLGLDGEGHGGDLGGAPAAERGKVAPRRGLSLELTP